MSISQDKVDEVAVPDGAGETGVETYGDFRADKFSYVALNAIWILFAVCVDYVVLFGSRPQDKKVWPFAVICSGFALVVFLLIRSYRITIRDGQLTYRFMFHRTRSVNLADIQSARVDIRLWRRNRGRPPYALVIEPSFASGAEKFFINMKFLSRKDLRILKQILGDKWVDCENRMARIVQ